MVIWSESCISKQTSKRYYLVESNSMLPAIHPEDYVVEDSILGDLNYGDIVRFEYVFGTKESFSPKEIEIAQSIGLKPNEKGEFIGLDVSRVVGLPDDSVGLIDNIVCINGQISKNKYINEVLYHDKDFYEPISFIEYEEILANDLSIKIYKSKFSGSADRDNANVVYIPADHYYLVGDSRCYSSDSRFYGPIPKNKILGKVVKIKSMRR